MGYMSTNNKRGVQGVESTATAGKNEFPSLPFLSLSLSFFFRILLINDFFLRTEEHLQSLFSFSFVPIS